MPRKAKPSLGRRRGTSSRRGGSCLQRILQSPHSAGICLLITIAILLTIGLLGMFVFVHSSSSTSTKTAPRQMAGLPNLLRGNVPEVPIPPVKNKEAGVVKNPKLDAIRDSQWYKQQHPEANQANTDQQTQKLLDQLDLGMYDQPPTKEYPYPLEPVSMDSYNVARDYTVKGGMRFSEYTSGGTPYKITDEIKEQSDKVARSRRDFIKSTIQFAWKGYQQYAFGYDEIKPQSKRGHDNWGGQGITLVDSLDTLWLAGLKDEFYQARDWVRDHLSHSKVGSVSVFETTIRDLGGLLAAYDWSKDPVFLDKALDLGERLLKAFDGSSTGIPFGQVNLNGGGHSNLGWAGGNAILAEFGSIQIEFRYLAKMKHRPEMAQKVENVYQILHDISPPTGLFPYYVRNNPGGGKTKPEFANDKITFGAMADSLYEYFLKTWIQGGKQEPMYREMYDLAIDSMHKLLLQTSSPSGLVYIADQNNGHLDHKMDHLVCFMGGLLALGAYTDPLGLDSERAQRDLRTGKALTYTCYQMYARMNTGISAEFVQFYPGKDFQIGRGAPHYLLRPEAVESMFILNQLTGDPIYREWGWEVYQSIEKYCKTEVGYGALSNVQSVGAKPRDSTESFFLAETMKYLYLLQDPDTEVDVLNKHVFNTEAHPLRTFPIIDQEGAP